MRLDEIIQQLFADKGIDFSYQSGEELKYRCPFHQSTKRQSHNSSINTATGSWHCYNGMCNESGESLVSFLAQLDGITFKDAITVLRENYGYTDEDLVFSEKKSYRSRENAYQYLPKTFRLISHTHPHVVENRFDFSVLQRLKVGIDLAKDEDGNYENLGAIIIPWFYKENCVGISKKYLDGKYNYDFKKSLYLYGFDETWKDKPVIVVEGPRDAWRLMGYHENVVALGGSKASGEQINLLLENWDRIILCLDGDEAGRIGMEKMVRKLTDLVDLSVITLPDGLDPCQIETHKEWEEIKKERMEDA